MVTITTSEKITLPTDAESIWQRGRRFIEAHPLATVLIAATIFRLIAVIFSRGFIHSDDHYDTVSIAYDWLKSGLLGPDGFMHWKDQPGIASGRFPLYTLSLFGIMKIYTWLGVQSLDTMMYGIRLMHALISMVPVVCAYAIVKRYTSNSQWAMYGGLAAALHFVMPFLGVRCLIEIVGGEIWLAAIYGFYRYREEREIKWLWFAGVMTGLAWMIRFQMAFAVLPIPFILWYEDKSVKGAIHYALAVGAMILLAWTADWFLMGRFASTTLTHLHINVDLDALYDTIPAMYVIILLAVFIPPLSLFLFWQSLKPSFVKKHLILVISSLSFLIWHWVLKNQQERFIFPMLPACLLMFVLALWHRKKSTGHILAKSVWSRGMVGLALGINAVGLLFLSVGYGHKGLIEPVVDIDQTTPNSRVFFLQPAMRPWIAYEYASAGMQGEYVKTWDEFRTVTDAAPTSQPFDYFVVYPKKGDSLAACLDSLTAAYGTLTPWRSYPASWYDQLLHVMNPRHNDNFAAYVYQPADKDRREE
jgi:4-amino-4-deoxy-L-arabinose transferase-like glycosyltransferase